MWVWFQFFWIEHADAMPTDLTRRALLTGLFMSAALMALAPPAAAKEGGSGGGGSDNSGPDGGGDDEDIDEEDDDHGNGSEESDRAREAVRHHKAVPIRVLLSHLNKNYPGRILDVDLKRSSNRLSYRVKILSTSGKVQRVRLDALTLSRM